MELIFLGTSSGAPTRQRNVSGLAIKESSSKNWFLVDCGEATQHQILKTKLSLNALQAICITHIHGDHCYGLPGLLASAGMQGRKDPLVIIAPKKIELWVNSLYEWTDLHLPYELIFHNVESFKGGLNLELEIEKHELSHRVPSYAYGFTSKLKEHKLDIEKLKKKKIPAGPIWGQIQTGADGIEFEGKTINPEEFLLPKPSPGKVIVGGDNDNPWLLKDTVQEAQVLVHEATYTQAVADKVGPAPQHSSAQQLAEFAEESKVRNLILTHFSARFQADPNKSPSILEVQKEAQKFYSGHLYLANDFDAFKLNSDGELTCLISND